VAGGGDHGAAQDLGAVCAQRLRDHRPAAGEDPKLEIESCSGGGGRVDLGILQRVEPAAHSGGILDGVSGEDPVGVGDGRAEYEHEEHAVPFRFLTAMQGALGIGSNLNRFTEKESSMAASMIGAYKRIRATVQTGDLYRIASPRTNDVTVNEYVSADGKQAVVFALRHAQQYNTAAPTIRLRGLDERATYKLESVNNKLAERQAQFSGAYLMNAGINVNLRGDFDATAIIVERN
jgi:alpha-galactosidase